MSYRDDLDAAQARARAAEQRAAALQKQVDELRAPAGSVPPELPIPERFTVAASTDELRVTWRWFRPGYLFFVLFMIVWDVGVVASLLAGTAPILGVIVSALFTYVVLGTVVNHTTVHAARGVLCVVHGPVPWLGNRELSLADLKQLYVQEHPGDSSSSWSLCVLRTNGKQLPLVFGLPERDHARYLEHAFERHLGIPDRKVQDEAPK